MVAHVLKHAFYCAHGVELGSFDVFLVVQDAAGGHIDVSSYHQQSILIHRFEVIDMLDSRVGTQFCSY